MAGSGEMRTASSAMHVIDASSNVMGIEKYV
jgi:hypothetical protein